MAGVAHVAVDSIDGGGIKAGGFRYIVPTDHLIPVQGLAGIYGRGAGKGGQMVQIELTVTRLGFYCWPDRTGGQPGGRVAVVSFLARGDDLVVNVHDGTVSSDSVHIVMEPKIVAGRVCEWARRTTPIAAGPVDTSLDCAARFIGRYGQDRQD